MAFRTLADRRIMSHQDRRNSGWLLLLTAVPIVSVLVGLTLVLIGQIPAHRALVRYGLLATAPAAAVAVVIALASLVMLAWRMYASSTEERGLSVDSRDEYISAAEIVPPRLDSAEALVPLAPAPRVPEPIISYTPAFAGAGWFAQLGALCAVPAEHRVPCEFLSRVSFRLGVPRTKVGWRLNGGWFFEFGPELVHDRRLKYVVLDLSNVSEEAVQSTVAFLILVSGEQGGARPERVGVFNPSRQVTEQLARYNVRLDVVDSRSVEHMRIAMESRLVCTSDA